MGSRRSLIRLSGLFVVVILFFFSHRNIVSAELTLRPTDTESLVGVPTFLNCSSDNVAEEIFWFRYEVGSTDRKLVYGFKKLYPPNEERFRLEKIEGAGTVAFNLVIPVTIDKDAGKYECQDGAGQGQLSPQVQLIVLVGAPVCETDMNRRPEGVIGPNSCGLTPEDIQMTCKVTFFGNAPPIVAWFRENSSHPITERVTQSQSSDSVIQNVTIAADSSIDGMSFECRLTRSPTVQHLCTTETVSVVGNNFVARTLMVVVICLAIAVPLAVVIGVCADRLVVKRRRRRKMGRPVDEKAEEEAYPLIVSNSHGAAIKNIVEWEEESKHLNDELNKYEKMIYRKDEAKYREKPNCAHNIETRQRSLISGIALLRQRLYVVHEKCSSIEVYDSKTFTFERCLSVEDLENSLDIASSESNECLYIAGKPRIHLEAKKTAKEETQTQSDQSDDNDRYEILWHDDDKDKNDVQKNKEFNRDKNPSKSLGKDPPQKGNNDHLSGGRRLADEAPGDTTDHSSEEHTTGEQLTGSIKDNEIPESDQQDNERKRSTEATTQSKDDRDESVSKEDDKNHSQRSDKKETPLQAVVEDKNIQRKHQVAAEVKEGQTTDGRTDRPSRDDQIIQLKTRETLEKADCLIVALKLKASAGVSLHGDPWTVDDTECRLSVFSSNVVVFLLNKRQIIEYSSSAEVLRRIGLSPGDGFRQLFHAIRVSQSYFAVSHSNATRSGDHRLSNAPLSGDHRLSLIDDKGKVKFTSESMKSSFSENERMNMSCLTVDCNKSILVSDAINCRVLLYNATLNNCTEFIPKEGVFSILVSKANCLKNQPTRITLDEENGILFIALKEKDRNVSENRGISVFKVV